ncbi:MAG TPA: hypothetical protein VLX92_19175 [Kofleriaceae bacterium]|nr:hypothetical protein [Kofleriaceae bacterium]
MKLAIASVAALAAVANAEPRVELARCTAFDVRALRVAIDRELPTDPALRTRDFAIVVECPDLATASLHVEPVPADGAIARTVDLGEVPTDLRLKLLALAVAELVEVAASDTSGPAPQVLVPVTDTIAPVIRPAPRAPPPRIAAAPPPDLEQVVSTGAPAPHPARWSLAPSVGMRLYTSTPTALAQAGAELALPWLRIGVRGALGTGSDALGSFRPYLATATVARDLACRAGLCLVARIEGGVAGVTARPASTAVAIAHDASAAYGQATLAGELVHRFTGWSVLASIEAGWAEGLIARAGGRDAAALAGPVVIGEIGVRFR